MNHYGLTPIVFGDGRNKVTDILGVKNIDFTSEDRRAVASRFTLISSIICIITLLVLIILVSMQLRGFSRHYSIFWLLLLDVVLYPVFLIFVRKERFQVVIIYIWFIIFFLQLGYFVYIQQGIFNHVELGLAICLFVSGFLLRPKHVIVFTIISCI